MYQWYFEIIVTDAETRIVARGISATIEHIRASTMLALHTHTH